MKTGYLSRTFSLLHIDYVKLNQKWNYNNVISPYYRLYYIEEGNGSISNNTTNLRLEPGYLYLIPSFTVCTLKCDNYLDQFFIHFFEKSPEGVSLFHNNRTLIKLSAGHTDITQLKRLLEINPGRGINRSDNPKIYEKEKYYEEYRSFNQNMKPSVQFENQGIILQLLSRFLNSPEFNSQKISNIPSKILEAMNYIQLNLHKTLTVSELAERAYKNKDYFSRQFYAHVGQRPLDYIHQKKIERAQYLITTTNKTLLEIANDTGFSNTAHFSKIFKKIVGIPPGQYKSNIN